MTVVEFAGSFIKIGNEDPILKMADEFLNEEVEFDDMPEDVRSWKQNAQIQIKGHTAIKSVTRTCRLKNGEDKVLTMSLKMDFDL